MRAASLAIALACAGPVALAQEAADPMAHLRACAAMEPAARLECLDKLSRSIAPAAPRPRVDSQWTISETTSPIDYTPIVTASTSARGGSEGGLARLTLYCRGGRTELTVSGPVVAGNAGEGAIIYRINDGQPVRLAAAAPAFGSGAAFRTDIVLLVRSLPEDGDLAVRLVPRTGPSQEGHFALAGIKAARDKVAAACRWPNIVADPGSR